MNASATTATAPAVIIHSAKDGEMLPAAPARGSGRAGREGPAAAVIVFVLCGSQPAPLSHQGAITSPGAFPCCRPALARPARARAFPVDSGWPLHPLRR